MESYVITIERGFGSGGKTIAGQIAQKLGVPCYDSEIMKMASDWSGLGLELFGRMNMRQRGNAVSRYVNKLDKDMFALPGFQFNDTHRDENLFLYQAEIIKGLARTQNCIILGYAANYILRKLPNVLSVNIQAPYHVCVQEIMERYSMTREQAAEEVGNTDLQRASFYRYFTGKDWISFKDFDMVLNSHRVGREKCVEMIIDLMRDKMKA